MKKLRREWKRVLAMILVVSLFPFQSFEGCFVQQVQAAGNSSNIVTQQEETGETDAAQSGAAQEETGETDAAQSGAVQEETGETDAAQSTVAEEKTVSEENSIGESQQSVEVTEDEIRTEEVPQYSADENGDEPLEKLVVSENYQLTEDMSVGQVEILSGTFNLNGHQLHVTGDLFQAAGILDINGGSLIVEGDYRIQSVSGEAGAYTYGVSSGRLKMVKAEDTVCIKGSFISDSSADATDYLTAGTMEVKGDMVVNSQSSQKSFVATGSHTLVLSGEGQQKVIFGVCDPAKSRLQNLEILNGSQEGIVIENKPHVSGHVKDNENKVSGYIEIGSTTTFENGSFTGSVSVGQYMEIKDNLSIGGNLALDKNTYATLTISGIVRVAGNCQQATYGKIVMNKGMLEICGNQTLSGSYAEVAMTHEEDYILVHGDVVFSQSYKGCTYEAGTYEIKGNLTSNGSLRATGTHKFLFSGEGRQEISLTANDYFAIIELKNYSQEGVYSATTFGKTSLIRNGCRLTYGDLVGEYGWTLEEDEVYEGDLILIEDTLDLNGHSLTVTGNLIQISGVVDINGGSLIVEGDYRMQSVSGEAGSYTYGVSSGQLKMAKAADTVCIKGSFFSDSSADATDYLTAGTMEVKGDMVVNSQFSQKSFVATGSHTLVLSGEEQQEVSFGVCDPAKSRLQNLEILNSSQEGIVIKSKPHVSGHVKDNENKVSGYIEIGSTTTFENGSFTGSVSVGQYMEIKDNLSIGGNLALDKNTYATLTISGIVRVAGNCQQATYGKIVMNKGMLEIGGNQTLSGSYAEVAMTHEEDYILVHGDVVFSQQYKRCTYEAGTYEIKGNLTSNGSVKATGTHKFLFSGEGRQEIRLPADDYFAVVELKNYSQEGVYSATSFGKTSLIRNGCRLTYGDLVGEYGWTLEEDEVYEGDLILIEDTLDLNGHSLTVTGNLIQISGVVDINGGSLTVEGDYRMQSVSGEAGSYTYGVSSGQLKMAKAEDTVCIKGSFFSDSSADATDYLTAGTMEVKGDMVVNSQSSQKSFVATGTHTLVLSGEGLQKVIFGVCDVAKSRLQNLEIRNESEEGIVIENKPYVSGHVKDNGKKVSGYIEIGSTTTFENGSYTGSVSIGQSMEIKDNLSIGGNLALDKNTYATLTISGIVRVAGNCEQSTNGTIAMNKGMLEIGGTHTLSGAYAEVEMTHAEDHILVHGDVVFSQKYKRCTYEAGTYEIKGNLTSNGSVKATGTHKFLFSGEGRQEIRLPADDYFAVVELKNYSQEGVYSATSFGKTSLIRNGCRLTYGDLVGEYGWTLEEDEVYEGDLILIEDTLDLNGHSLTVTGNLIQISGVVDINGGSLTVEGDYRIQSVSGEAGSYTYGVSSGQLKMVKAEDTVCIKGSFISDSSADATDYLTAGTMEVKGDMVVNSQSSQKSFVATGSHTLILGGEEQQKVSFGVCDAAKSRLRNLEIRNTSQEGIVIKNRPFVSGHVKDNGNKVSGYIEIGSTTTFENGSFTGSIFVGQATEIKDNLSIGGNLDLGKSTYTALTISGNVRVAGNCQQATYGKIVMNKGMLEIGGNQTLSGAYAEVEMTHEEDHILVHGDVVFSQQNKRCTYEAGTYEIKGNLTSNGSLRSKGAHKFLFSGEGRQEIRLTSDDYFAVVELRNYSQEGVYSATTFGKTSLIRNGCRLTYGDLLGEYGWTLEEDEVYEGDLIIIEDTLDLNGHSLTVTGDLIQLSGVVDINGGSLTVEGDYRMQNRMAENGSYEYGESTSQLKMQDIEDYVLVKGSLIIQTTKTFYGNISAGTMEIKGDIIQKGSNGFRASSGHTLIFSGGKTQTWTQEEYTSVGNIINRNNKKLSIQGVVTAEGTITDETNTVSGTGHIRLNALEQIKDNTWSGAVCIVKDGVLADNLKVGHLIVGEANNNVTLQLGSHTVEVNDITVYGTLEVQKAQVAVKNDFVVDNKGTLKMQDENAYVLVGGNFTMSTSVGHSGFLTDGTMEIKGHFTQNSYANFIASDNHAVILSKKNIPTGNEFIQNISFNSNAGVTRFNKLILRRNMEGYFFKNDLNTIANEIVYDIEDVKAPSPITQLWFIDTTITTITLAYNGAEDESGILGYEIYRDGVRVAVTSQRTYTDMELLPGKEYTYTVYAFDAYRNLAPQSPELVVSTLPDTEAPSIPKDITMVTRTGSSITIKWNKSTDNVGVTGYSVYRNGELIVQNLSETEYKDTGLKTNTVYVYDITASDMAGNVSKEASSDNFLVAMPEITGITPADHAFLGGDTVKLSVKFKNVGNATGNKVKIEYKENGGNWKSLTPNLLEQTRYSASVLQAGYVWDISGITESTEYQVRYTLYDGDGNTDVEERTYHIDNEAPQLPANIQGVAENGTAKIEWDPSISSDCAGYKVYRKTQEENGYTLIATITDKYDTSYTDKEVSAGKTYQYVLTTEDSFGNISEYSQEVSVTINADAQVPTIKEILPKDIKITQKPTIVVEAEDNQKVAKIRLEYRQVEAEDWIQLDTVEAVDNKASYQWDTTTLADDVYMLRAIAIDASGNESEKEYFKRYEVDNTGIGKIVISHHTAYSTGVQIHWEDVAESDFGYFQVEQLIDGRYQKIATVTNYLGYNVENLEPNATYHFRVVGYDKVGNRGMESDELEVVISADTIQPTIEMVPEENSAYSDSMELRVQAKDNYAIDKAVFSYSLDNITYTEIATVETENKGKRETLTYNFDVTQLPEGKVYIKYEVYDVAGNKNALLSDGKEVIGEYVIDHTAPGKVSSFAVNDLNGHVKLVWPKYMGEDISAYRIYKAKENMGIFESFYVDAQRCDFQDGQVTMMESYIYKIAVVDKAGNEGECSEEVYVTVMKDTEAPKITSLTIDNREVSSSTKIVVSATDNAGLSHIVIEYCWWGEMNGTWSKIAEVAALDRAFREDVIWNTESLEEGKYVVRAYAVDRVGNVSEVFYDNGFIHRDAQVPSVPQFNVQNEHFEVTLQMEESADSDFSHFEIYRKRIDEDTFVSLGETKESTYTDQTLDPNITYTYKVAAYDISGNYTWSELKEAMADDIDVVSPEVVLPECILSVVGMEVELDGLLSTDNVRILSYEWNTGDGMVVNGAAPSHIYSTPGEYELSLTLTDAAGNKTTGKTKVKVIEKSGAGKAVVKVVNENGSPISYAQICLLEDGENTILYTNQEGKITIPTKVGTHTIYAYKAGYLPEETNIEISANKDKEYTISLTEDELIISELTVHRMTIEEMEELGVDFSNPSNYVRYSLQLSIPTSVGGGVWGKENTIKVELYPDKNTVVKKNDKSHTIYKAEYERSIYNPRIVFCDYVEIAAMYEVKLGIISQAGPSFVIDNTMAEISFEDPLEFGITTPRQTYQQPMGEIYGQQSASVSWVVRSRKVGTYKLSATFKGRLMPFNEPIEDTIETEAFFEVVGAATDDNTNGAETGYLQKNGQFSYGGKTTDYSIDYFYDDRFFLKPATADYSENRSLAFMSMCMAWAAYGSKLALNTQNNYSNYSQNIKSLLYEIGFKDNIEVNDQYDERPGMDTIGCVAGSKKLTVEDKEYTLIAVAIRGGNYESEWAGNFLVGTEGEHDGFEIAKNEVLSFIKSYIEKHEITGDIKLWITGYSRAGGVANLVSGELNRNPSKYVGAEGNLVKENIYAYCFEPPKGMIAIGEYINKSQYRNIKNVQNPADFVPKVAMSQWGFGRYGQTFLLPSLGDTDYATKVALVAQVFNTLPSNVAEGTKYSLDQFQMNKINWRTLLLDSLPGGNKVSSPLTNYIVSDDNYKWAQAIFLDNFIGIVTTAVPSRIIYVEDDYQSALRILFDLLMGNDNDAWKAVISEVGIFLLLSILIQNNESDDKTMEELSSEVVNEAVELFLDRMHKHGISMAGRYTKDDIAEMIKALANLLYQILKLDANQSPNYVLSCLTNLGTVGQAHLPELCYAWLLTDHVINASNEEGDGTYSGSDYYKNITSVINAYMKLYPGDWKTKLLGITNGDYRVLSVNCPVDVEVYNSENELVAAIENDVPVQIEGEVNRAYMNQNGEKEFILAVNDSYTVKIKATDDGTVSYSVKEFCYEAGEVARVENYFDIPIKKGDELIGNLSEVSEDAMEEGTENGSDAEYKLYNSQGSLLTPDVVLAGEEIEEQYYSVSVENANSDLGIALGGGSALLGSYVKLEAYPNEDAAFAGWYENGVLVSEEQEYRVRVEQDRVLEARFTSTGTGEDEGGNENSPSESEKKSVASFVTRMYQLCLSREPDQAGLDGWVSQLEKGYMTGADIAKQFIFGEEMIDKNLSDAAFVEILYKSLLGREADESGKAGWVSQLQKGNMTRIEVTKAFAESTEFTQICEDYGITRGTYDASDAMLERFVLRFYNLCLERSADQPGLYGWVSNLKKGYMNGAQMADVFFFGKEFIDKSTTNQKYIELLYTTILGRKPDSSETAGWISQLQKGNMTRMEIMKSFIESVEFTDICNTYGITRGTYDASDAKLERFVLRFYSLCLEREADQPGLYGWVSNLKNRYMNGAQMADAFFFSEEFLDKSVSNEKYVELLYKTILGRTPAASETAGWIYQLNNEYMSRRDIMEAFIESKEFTDICTTYGIVRGNL